MSNNKDYEVGYGKPPKSGQFKKGQSGNTKGRPKGGLSFNAMVEKEMNAKIKITENGQQKTITKKEAMVKQLARKAMTGDHRAITTIAHVEGMEEVRLAQGQVAAREFSPEDKLVIANVLKRIRQGAEPPVVPAANEEKAGD